MKSDTPPEYTNRSSDNYEDEFPQSFQPLNNMNCQNIFKLLKIQDGQLL